MVDATITALDKHPIKGLTYPPLHSPNGGFTFKKFDFNFMFLWETLVNTFNTIKLMKLNLSKATSVYTNLSWITKLRITPLQITLPYITAVVRAPTFYSGMEEKPTVDIRS